MLTTTVILLFLTSVLASTLLYYYLHYKTRISLKYLFQDNVVVILFSFLLSYLLLISLPANWSLLAFVVNILLVGGTAFSLTMIRFWRTPKRRCKAPAAHIISPADGNVIYIEKVEAGEVPVSIKGNTLARLEELTKTNILEGPCWLIGINMTPFDVHKNCAPVPGKVVLNRHFDGKFLSLKDRQALKENERQTIVFDNNGEKVGIVQTASKLVRRIDTYVKEGDVLQRGQWVGMIRFGSQVDLIIPRKYDVKIKLKDQVYAGESVIADFVAADCIPENAAGKKINEKQKNQLPKQVPENTRKKKPDNEKTGADELHEEQLNIEPFNKEVLDKDKLNKEKLNKDMQNSQEPEKKKAHSGKVGRDKVEREKLIGKKPIGRKANGKERSMGKERNKG